ncbi:hypothetical protein [Adlercreutzia aquisgranensis]|uniref:hypothetical protein n=1 Tax=Adlercreutzia aquisgranensis TaxID=2941323 RepID=UPI00203E2524|nr:hypothetical protein [Adlercreutzia aquisgranensis]
MGGLRAKLLFAISTVALLVGLQLSGCSYDSFEKDVPECPDYAGNILQNCEASVHDFLGGSEIAVRFHEEKVLGVRLDCHYGKWVEEGRPKSAIDYVYYYLYPESGDRCVVLYSDGSDVCFSVGLDTPDGESLGGSLFVDGEGKFLRSNPVSGYRNSDRAQKEIDKRYNYYHEQAASVLLSLDQDYFAKKYPASCISREQ